MDPQLTTIQPGGGIIINLEMLWGRWRRFWLKTFRPGYVKKMESTRKGDFNPCPHDVLDPRDLKYHENQGGYYWEEADDPFAYRSRLPFAREGLAELFVLSTLFFGGAALLSGVILSGVVTGVLSYIGWLLVLTLVLFGMEIVWFFRNPQRTIPAGEGVIVSPADGTFDTIEEIAHHEYIGGPAIEIGIFLSIFNVHINRMPVAGKIIKLAYRPGKCLNALRPESTRLNERLEVYLQMPEPTNRPMLVQQITGAIARRIVCRLKPGDELTKGAQFGMIKLGSRTVIVFPQEEGLEILAKPGDKLKAGSTILAKYAESPTEASNEEA
ncbi:phosphatidylserine decarboxylase family protein [Gimesia benthica]|jgi:phosphatidylserine decarboxylase|uniref:Phosphatidylserine decarboxylase family protein n=2 Tax=Gimesia TaxID=1649453 RepID=A0A6I6AP05_9PLAN|nr:phosphatidylserine decarboxylase family protein [Gimesia benthica]